MSVCVCVYVCVYKCTCESKRLEPSLVCIIKYVCKIIYMRLCMRGRAYVCTYVVMFHCTCFRLFG